MASPTEAAEDKALAEQIINTLDGKVKVFLAENPKRAEDVKKMILEIKERFISYTSEHYGLSVEKCEEVIGPFIQVILAHH